MNIDQFTSTGINNNVLVVCPNPAIDIYAHVSTIKPQLPNRFIAEERYPGGKGIHVAMALAEMGINVTVIGFWGGITGEWIKNQCCEYYPSIQFDGIDLNEWSRLCYTMISDQIYDHTEFLGTGPKINQDLETLFIDIVDQRSDAVDAIVCSGSWPTGASAKAYQSIIENGKKRNIQTFLDCTGSQLSNALKVKPFGIHLNRNEVTEFCNNSDFEICKREILKSCTKAFITDGKDGLYACTEQAEYHAKITLDNIISTVGSGDCLLAGIVAGHVLNLSDEDIASLGASFGSANCVRKELGMLHIEDIQHMLNQVSTKELIIK